MISKKLTIELLTGSPKLLTVCSEVFVASALTSNWAIDFILRNLPVTAKFKLMLGIHLPSSPAVLEKLLLLQAEKKLECRLYTEAFFHTKLYLLRAANHGYTFVGSGNFTSGGLKDHVELFHKSEDDDEFNNYLEWFDRHFQKSIPLTQYSIDVLKSVFTSQVQVQQSNESDIKVIADILSNRFNLEAIDFTGQFFQKAHHETFAPGNKTREDDVIMEQREKVRLHLFKLHDLVLPALKIKPWDLHEHYVINDIVSKTELTFHRSREVGAMWIHYGRSYSQIKKYGENETPLFFARLQVIIHYEDIGVWLRFGKAGGSRQDRDYFHQQMNNSTYRTEIWKLLQPLQSEYWIVINGQEKELFEFKAVEEFWEFTRNDDWQNYYFIIGKSFDPGDKAVSKLNIVSTVIQEFTILYPLYSKMKDKSFS